MKPEALLEEFRTFLGRKKLSLGELTPKAGLAAMLEFYATARVPTAQSDMLLFQWGTFDFGKGPSFQLDLTRQLIWIDKSIRFDDEEDDDSEEFEEDYEQLWQMHLTFHWAPSAALSALGKSSFWCEGATELETFRAKIHGSPSFLTVADLRPERVALDYEDAE